MKVLALRRPLTGKMVALALRGNIGASQALLMSKAKIQVGSYRFFDYPKDPNVLVIEETLYGAKTVTHMVTRTEETPPVSLIIRALFKARDMWRPSRIIWHHNDNSKKIGPGGPQNDKWADLHRP